MKKILTFVLVVFILSCRKDKFEGIGSPSIVWRADIIISTSPIHSIQPIVYKDKVVVTNLIDTNYKDIVVILDKKTGAKLSETQVSPTIKTWISSYYYFENLIAFVSGNGIQCFDINTSSIKWTMTEQISNAKQVDSLIFGVQNGKMVKLNILTKEIKQLNTTVGSTQNFWTSSVFYDVYKNAKQDVCMTYVDTQNPQQYFLVSVNLSNSMLISKSYISNKDIKGGFASYFKVKNDKLYFGDSHSIICMNVLDGTYLWRQNVLGNGSSDIGTEAFLGDKNLFIGSTTYLYAFDLLTGKEAWAIKNDVNNIGFSSLQAFYYHHKTLYFASEELVAIDEDSGNVIWSFLNKKHTKSPVTFYTIPRGEGDFLYIPTDSKIMCLVAAQ